MLARCLTPFMPHLAEECWARLGEKGFVSAASWPGSDPAFMVDDTITLPVQVNGKRRSEIAVPRDAGADVIEAAARADAAVVALLEGKAVRKVIVVPGRIVNIVAS